MKLWSWALGHVSVPRIRISRFPTPRTPYLPLLLKLSASCRSTLALLPIMYNKMNPFNQLSIAVGVRGSRALGRKAATGSASASWVRPPDGEVLFTKFSLSLIYLLREYYFVMPFPLQNLEGLKEL